MSEIINSAVIKVEIDAAGVEVGLRKIDDGAAKTGKSLENLGRSDGFAKLGDGAEQAAVKFSGGTKSIIEAIERRTASMELGKRGTVEYYAALANQKGINPAILKPYLDQLDAVTRKTAEATAAQQRIDDGARFLESLRVQNAELGKSASQLAAMRAEQLGVSEAAGPLIAKLQESEEAAGGLGGALGVTTGALAAFIASIAGAVSIGAFVASVSSAVQSLADLDDMSQKTGASVDVLSRLQKVAQQTGQDFGQVDAALVKLARGMGGLDEDSNKVTSALKLLGVSSRDAAGKLRDPGEVLIETSTAFQKYADGAEKTKLANDLIKGSGAELLPFLNDVSENVGNFAGASKESAAAASAFGDNMGILKVRLSEMGNVVATNLLPYLVKFSEFVKDVAESDRFKSFLVDAGNAISALAVFVAEAGPILVTGAKIAAAYFAIFVGLPAVVTIASTALAFLYSSTLRVTGSFAAGSGAAGIFNTSLFGTTVAANLAAGALTKMQLAGSVLIAAFAGWQIGTYLREQFAMVRIAGLVAIESLLVGFEKVKYYSVLAFDAINFAWDKVLGDMKVKFAGYIQSVANGLALIGASDTSSQVSKYAESLRMAGVAQQALAAKTVAGSAAMTTAHAATLKAIRSNIAGLIESEALEGRVGVKVLARVKKDARPPAPGTPDKPKDNGATVKSIKDVADAYDDVIKVQAEYALNLSKTVAEAIKEAEANEFLVQTFGLSKQAIAELEIVRMEERLERLRGIEMADDEVAALELVITAKKRSAAAMGQVAGLEANKKANAEMAADWKKTVDKYDDIFRNGFADMLNNGKDGWKSFTKSLTTTFKTTVADQIYRMFAQPFVMKLVASLIGVTGTGSIAQAAGIPGVGGEGTGIQGILASAKQAYTAITSGFQSISTSVSSGVRTGLNAVGVNSGTASSLGSFAGTAASYAGGAAVGVFGGRTISNGFSAVGNSGNTLVNAGTIAGAIVGGPIGAAIGGMIGGLGNRLFGRKAKEFGDTTLNGSFGANGFAGTSDTSFFQKGGVFRSDKRGTDKVGVDATTAAQFASGYEAIKVASADFAKTLGLNANALEGRAQSLSLKLGKDQAENEAAVAKFFTNVADTIASELLPNLSAFAVKGEAASATLQRIAGNYAFIDVALDAIGKTFGAVGLESVAARERLVTLSGGIESLGKGAAFFAQNFLTEAERLAPVAVKLKASLADMGLAYVDTRDEFKSIVLGLDLTTASGAATYAGLMRVQEAFNQVYPAAEAARNALSERIELQKEYDSLTLTAAQQLAKTRAALDPSNRGAFDQVQAAKAAKLAQDAMRTSLGDLISKMRTFGESARALGDGLKLSDLSILAPEQQYAEARRQYESTLAAAKGGDATAQSNFSSIATTFLEASQRINGGDSTYAADFNGVMTTADEIAKWSANQVDVAQASLDALNSQVSALGQLNLTMEAVAAALTPGVDPLIGALPRMGGEPNYAAMGTLDMAPLAAELKAVRAELASLRAEQNAQTGAMIQSNVQATMQAAVSTVEGTENAMVNMTWRRKNHGAEVLE